MGAFRAFCLKETANLLPVFTTSDVRPSQLENVRRIQMPATRRRSGANNITSCEL